MAGRDIKLGWLCLAVMLALGVFANTAWGYSANKVWFETRPEGIFRVHVNFTVPELKERREAYVQFTSKKKAEKLYWDLVQGADFFPPDPEARRFVAEPMAPEPW